MRATDALLPRSGSLRQKKEVDINAFAKTMRAFSLDRTSRSDPLGSGEDLLCYEPERYPPITVNNFESSSTDDRLPLLTAKPNLS